MSDFVADASTIETAIATTASGPKRVMSDAGMVMSQDLSELIQAHRYVSAQAAATTRTRGLRFSRLIPPGTVACGRSYPSWDR